MRRHSTWRSALSAYIHEVAAKPFLWGEFDCAIFAAGAVHAMTGEDFAEGWRGRYRTPRGAAGALKRKGFDSAADLAASLLEEIHPSHAQVGDIAVIPIEGNATGAVALGVVQGPRIYVVKPGEAGIGTVDLLDAKRAFRVPFVEGDAS